MTDPAAAEENKTPTLLQLARQLQGSGTGATGGATGKSGVGKEEEQGRADVR